MEFDKSLFGKNSLPALFAFLLTVPHTENPPMGLVRYAGYTSESGESRESLPPRMAETSQSSSISFHENLPTGEGRSYFE